ncbi:MAG TPA: CDP-archaeol synthase [Candidatus Paceibacterota bacterium]|nr:CDP-archaeol synthase [Candidatus Paceibacterota bacterium]
MSILFLLYVALPAFVANMLPIVAARLQIFPQLDRAIHASALGAHKTWRGIVVGVFGAIAVALAQWAIGATHLENIAFALAFGVLSGAGALAGDAIKSLIKRRVGIAPGAPWIPFDHIDYMLGFLVVTYPLYNWSMREVLILVVSAFILNPLANVIGYISGIKRTYW